MFSRILQISALLALACPVSAESVQPPTGVCQVDFGGEVTRSIVNTIIADIKRICSRDWQLKLTISSGGGQVTPAIKLHDFLVDWPQPVHTHGVSVQSAAVIFFLAGDKRTMSKNGVLMLHPIVSENADAESTDEEVLIRTLTLRILNQNNIDFMSRVTNQPREYIEQLVASATELTPDRAKELGFVHEVVP